MVEIYLDALTVISRLEETNEAKRTHIMYAANTSWSYFTDMMMCLLDEELIAEYTGEDGGRLYRLTKDGKDAVRCYKKDKLAGVMNILDKKATLHRNVIKRGLEKRVEVLKSVRDLDKGSGAKPTHIMYRNIISWDNLQNILDDLKDGGYVEDVIKGVVKRYRLTEKGEEALNPASKAAVE